MSSVQFLADSTAADDTLQRRSFHCLRNGFTKGVNKTHTQTQVRNVIINKFKIFFFTSAS